MQRIVQEKFEVHGEPASTPQKHDWVSDKSARNKNGMQTRSGAGRYNRRGEDLNDLPPGMNIEDQQLRDIPSMPMNTQGGMGPGGDRTQDLSVRCLREGFDRKRLRPTDDMYTREHNDAFYDSVEVDGVEGFVERNNMLDRM